MGRAFSISIALDTAHLRLADTSLDQEQLLHTAAEELRERFHLTHVTLQLESGDCSSEICG